jgi:hypothetical protein
LKLSPFPKTPTVSIGTCSCGFCPRVFTRTTVFDNGFEITIDGGVYTDFDGLIIKESVDGAGLSGLVSSELFVNIYTDYFHASDNAEVILTIPGVNINAKFYITRREAVGRKVSLSCRSKLYRLDIPCHLTDSDFDEHGEIDTYTAISRIASMGNLTSFSYQGGNPFGALPRLNKDFLTGKNCLSVLEKISAALCGVFREYNDGLVFIPWRVPFMQSVPTESKSEIKRGFVKTVGKVSMTGGGKTYVSGNGGYTSTIKLDTPLASEDAAAAVLARNINKDYAPYSADVKLALIPPAPATLTFDDVETYTNSIVCYPRRSGIYAKVSCNAVNEDEWDYSGEIERAVREKITAGERFGNMTITSDGQIKLDNDNIEEPQTAYICATEDYGVMVKTPKAAFEAETLSLEEVPEIKLNSEELLTESKDLVGALNELFLAAPEGGEGLTDISVLDDCHCGKVFGVRNTSGDGKYGFWPGMIGVYYAEAQQIPDLTLTLRLLMDYRQVPEHQVTTSYSVWVGNDSEDGVMLESAGTFTHTYTLAANEYTYFTMPMPQGEYNYWAILPEGVGGNSSRFFNITPNRFENYNSNALIASRIYSASTPSTQQYFAAADTFSGAMPTKLAAPQVALNSVHGMQNLVTDYNNNPYTPAQFSYGAGVLNQALAVYNSRNGG